jgi:homoserine trans-succinylase
MPLSKRLQNMMSTKWGKNRNTKPLRNTLANRAASVLTKKQIMNILSYNPVLAKNVIRAIEHRAKNLQNENIRSFMVNYNRRIRRLKNK